MIPRDYQIDMANNAYQILKAHGLVYIAAQERTGKTLTSILVAEQCSAIKNVLVITKKKALDGWAETLSAFKHDKVFMVTNYHQADKINFDLYDLVIIDEAHNYISSYPKTSSIWKKLKAGLRLKPIIYISATPYAQGPQLLFHQFALSSFGPWVKFRSFYDWFKTYGEPYSIKLNSIDVQQYDKVKTEKVLESCQHLFVTKTRAELGFEFEPEDKLHYITLSDDVRTVYNYLMKHQIVEIQAGMLVCDTTSKLRYALYQLEGGTAKIGDENIILSNTDKIDYILKHFGDTEDMVIMYNFQAEGLKLANHFKKALLLQATTYAEGVDLYKYKHLIIYSQDFSTARFSQRRARQCNMNRKEPITVHFILVKKGLSEQVYKTVCKNMKNFVDSVFERSTI